MSKIPLIVVAGPTASGKTGLAIELAKAIGGEIVSADSMQIYKYMDIGTAKPTAEEQGMAKHHLIDFLEPDEEFSVADYTLLAHKIILDITNRNKIPIIAGGTGLYINSVVNDVDFGEIKTDYAVREYYTNLAREQGNDKLIEILAQFDPESAKKLHPNNLKRVVRAIEFYKTTGVPISKHQEETKKKESRYSPIMFMPNWDREELYDRINTRVDIMLDNGLLNEVKQLLDMGYTKDLNSMQGIGYKELIDFLNGECSFYDAVDRIKQGSRNYAKRQLTWFKRDERIHLLNPKVNMLREALMIISQ